MNSYVRDFARSVDATLLSGEAALNEGGDILQVSGLTSIEVSSLAGLASKAGLTWTAEDSSSAQLREGDVFDPAFAPFRFTIEKPAREDTKVIYTIAGLRRWLEDGEGGHTWMHVLSESPFHTWGRRFVVWGQSVPPYAIRQRECTSPIDLVRQSGEPSVPNDIRPWIVDGPSTHYPINDPVFNAWAEVSVGISRRVLANEILVDGTLVFSGPPRFKVSDTQVSSLDIGMLRDLQAALRWVFDDMPQTETRHGLLSSEIARVSERKNNSISADDIVRAIEGAKIAFQIMLSDVGRDSLKAIGELRKSVTEEIGKFADATRQVASAMAGAVFLGLGVIAAKLSSNINQYISALLVLVLLLYVISIVASSNHFLKINERIRSEWKNRYYKFLGDNDYVEFVIKPLDAARRGFQFVAWISVILSVLLAVGVVCFVNITPVEVANSIGTSKGAMSNSATPADGS
jgi:hypothetical protein